MSKKTNRNADNIKTNKAKIIPTLQRVSRPVTNLLTLAIHILRHTSDSFTENWGLQVFIFIRTSLLIYYTHTHTLICM